MHWLKPSATKEKCTKGKCLRNERTNLENNPAIAEKETEHHTIDSFYIGQNKQKKPKIQCKLCQKQNQPWFRLQ